MQQQYTLQELRNKQYKGHVKVNNQNDVYYFDYNHWGEKAQQFTDGMAQTDDAFKLVFTVCTSNGLPLSESDYERL